MSIQTNTFITAKAPDLGAFPLDHYRECKKEIEGYYHCLKDNNYIAPLCRDGMRTYLTCRMERGLMKQNDLESFNIPETDFVLTRQHREDLRERWIREKKNQSSAEWKEAYVKEDIHIPDGFEQPKESK